MMRRSAVVIAAFALIAAACSGAGSTATTAPTGTTQVTTTTQPAGSEDTMTDDEMTDDEMTDDEMAGTTFTVTIENTSDSYPVSSSGAFAVPDGADGPGPLLPGGAYSFDVYAVPGQRVSFATMLVQSNDLFLAPADDGLALYSGDTPISGDVTDQVTIWDAGTEIDQPLGSGEDQAPRQTGPGAGAPDEIGTVRMLMGGDRGLPEIGDLVSVTVTPGDGGLFTITITNVSEASELETPFAPGVFAVHAAGMPLFTDGQPDRGDGLEALAEDGDPSVLADALADQTGVTTPLAPGVFVVHGQGMPLFVEGESDRGEGLEALAEDGDPGPLAEVLMADAMYESGVFNTPDGASEPGPALPGASYSFSFTAAPGDRLSFATMFVQSNDWFYAPESTGLALFDDHMPISGDVTGQVFLWNAGTEVDQAPGFGPDQPVRQAGPDTGADENGTVTMLPGGGVKVTVTPQS